MFVENIAFMILQKRWVFTGNGQRAVEAEEYDGK
jgi:hypothetical protein